MLFYTSCSGVAGNFEKGQERNRERVIKDVLSCQPLLEEKSLRPQVCGRCELIYRDNKLIIAPAEGCPAYEVLKCTTKGGDSFTINNLSCKPLFR
jgi:hypothetical protein